MQNIGVKSCHERSGKQKALDIKGLAGPGLVRLGTRIHCRYQQTEIRTYADGGHMHRRCRLQMDVIVHYVCSNLSHPRYCISFEVETFVAIHSGEKTVQKKGIWVGLSSINLSLFDLHL